jgi:hypothetical protein
MNKDIERLASTGFVRSINALIKEGLELKGGPADGLDYVT